MWRAVGSGDLDYTAVWGRGPDDVFVAGNGGGLERTRDHGKTWQTIKGLGAANLYAIAGDAHVLLIGGQTGELAITGLGGGLGTTPSGAVGVAQLAHKLMENHGVVFRSDDDGRTFHEERTTTGIVLGLASVDSEVIAATCGKAAVQATAQASGKTIAGYAPFLRSSDGGKSWNPVRFSFDLHVTSAAMAAPPLRWICGAHGVIRVADGFVAYGRSGAAFRERAGTWTALHPLAGTVHAMWWDGAHALYAAVDRDLMRSTDLGKTWVKLAAKGPFAGIWGSSPEDIYAVGGDPQGPTIIHSTDGGATWHAEPIAPPPPDAIWGGLNPVAIWGANKDEVYVVGPNGMLLEREAP